MNEFYIIESNYTNENWKKKCHSEDFVKIHLIKIKANDFYF